MINTMHITASHGVQFCVRMLYKGDKFGLDDCLTYDKDEPQVEFYDSRYPHTKYGQFVSRYYSSTMLEHVAGLNLQGGVPVWCVDDAAMSVIRAWIQNEVMRHD